MEAFVKSQEDIAYKISRSYENYKKRGKAKMTKGATQVQMQQVQHLFDKYVEQYEKMLATEGVDTKHKYFTEDLCEEVRNTYMDVLGEFKEYLNSFEIPHIPERHLNLSNAAAPTQAVGLGEIQLQPLPCPTFSGNYLEWTSFQNLFEAAMSTRNYTNLAKLQYLRLSVKGEAGELIKDLPATEDNYEIAWNMLKDQYDNKRRVVTLLLESMLSTNSMTSDSAAELKRIIKGINSPLATLETLERPVKQWSDLLVYLTVSKLSSKTRMEWETSLKATTDPPTYEALMEFLKNRQVSLESFEASGKRFQSTQSKPQSTNQNSNNVKSQQGSKTFTVDVGKTTKTTKCACCSKTHELVTCQQFLDKTVKQRHFFVKRHRLCYCCLQQHAPGDCKAQFCSKCGGKHHDLVHFEKVDKTQTPVSSQSNTDNSQASNSNVHLAKIQQIVPETVLLATAWITIENEAGETVTARALIDQCAQSSFISESLCQRLKLPRKPVSLPVNGLGSKRQVTCRSITGFVIKPHFPSNFSCEVTAYVLPKVSSYHPITKKQEASWSHLQRLTLADPHYHRTGVIDVLLGATVHAQIVEGYILKGLEHEPIATKTQLGWIISGGCVSTQEQLDVTPTVLHCATELTLSELVQKFWLQEEIKTVKLITQEEEQCENHFVVNFHRRPGGEYEVRLPFKEINSVPSFIDLFAVALKLLHRMEALFDKDEIFKELYHAFIREYIDLKHMSLLPISPEELLKLDKWCLLPHHGIYKDASTTTKLRTVFNGSAKTRQGVSLNDCLHVGENLLPELANLVLFWRNYRYAFSADVEKMFRKILVAPEDQMWQLILWRFDPSQPVQIYKLHTVTYGMASSPFLANRVMRQLAEDEKSRFPLGAEILKNEIYMDDVISGGHCLESARQKREETLELCKVGGFPLRKWLANDPSLLAGLSKDLLAAEPGEIAESDSCFAILGLKWQPVKDHFQFTIKNEEKIEKWTKRLVLSKVAKLFDPLGWLAPVVIVGKIFIQQLWLLSLDWDHQLPEDKTNEWLKWYDQLPAIADIRIPRWTGFTPSAHSIQIHGFADASKVAYGAVVYLRTVTSSGITVSLIQAKSKVAPIQTLSMPRLELSAAHMLAKLVHRIKRQYIESDPQVYLYSDSLDVLHWLRELPSKWPTFVANRCANIHTLVPDAHWSHIDTDYNPADYVSRGVMPSELGQLEPWWSGPYWLKENQSNWPTSLLEIPSESRQSFTSQSIPSAEVCTATVQKKKKEDLQENLEGIWRLFEVTSTWSALVRRLAYWLRLIDHLHKKKPSQSELFNQTWYMIEYNIKDRLTTSELDRARHVWIYLAQRYHFSKDIDVIAKGENLMKSSALFGLDPILSETLLFVGGRLKNSLLSLDEKHPLILPSYSRLSVLIVKDCHIRTLHGGVQLTLSTLRRQYWIIGGRQQVKAIIKDCLPCLRFRASESYEKMSHLPTPRVRPSNPFSQSGVDYAGPIRIRVAPGRGQKSYKGYICIFICLSTKAVHLEAVSSLTSNAFLSAFRRFTSTRGPCKLLWSDQGTNFVGADRELKELHQRATDHIKEIRSVLANEGTQWRFNPPAAPHFGGIWEAAVKSTKYHLRRVIGDNTLTFEEYSTLLDQISACLNSRPLTPLTDDPTDLDPLTPAHFLTQSASYIVPEPDYTGENIPASKRWQIVQQMMQGFWYRWSREYLQTLQRRNKWNDVTNKFKKGDLALLKDENTPPAQWPLARITAVHPSDDGLIRKVTVRTANSTFDRPIAKLIRLPIDTEEEDEEEENAI